MKRAIEIALIVILFVLILFPKWVTIATILFLLLYTIEVIRTKVKFKASFALLILPAFYLIYLFGLINTTDFGYAEKDLMSKLSLIVFPIAFSFPIKLDLKLIAKAFVLFCVLSGLGGIVQSFQELSNNPDLGFQAFRNSYIGFKMHTTYLSWYYTLSIILIVNYWLKKEVLFKRWIDVVLILFFTPFLYLLGSFSGLLFALIFAGVIALILFKRRFGKKAVFGGSIALILVSVGMYFIPYLNKEINRGLDEFTGAFTNQEAYFEVNRNQTESFKARALLWSVALKQVQKQPMGYGTGDGKNEFVKATKSLGLAVGEKELNPHNQYFQTTLAVGLIGLALFLGLIIIHFYGALNSKSLLWFFMISSMAFHALFESILELQNGIVFFCLLTCVFINDIRSNWTHSTIG